MVVSATGLVGNNYRTNRYIPGWNTDSYFREIWMYCKLGALPTECSADLGTVLMGRYTNRGS